MPLARRALLALSLVLPLALTAAEIHDAVLAHDISRVRQLLLEHPDLVNARNEKGDTPLYIAAFRGYKQMLPLLLQFGADPNPAPNLRMETPLSIARERNLRQTSETLIRAGAKEDDLSRGAEIRYLTMRRDPSALAARLAKFPHLIEARNAFGQTPLTFAVAGETPDIDTVQTLLKFGANPNATNHYGGTPYSVAVDQGHTNVIALLLKHGAQETPVTRSAPLRIAARNNLLAEADELLRKSPEMVHGRDDLRLTPLHFASSQGLLLVQLLVRHGADVNARDFADNTPLHAAAQAGKADIVKFLLERKADPNVPNRQRVTPLLHAASSGSFLATEALLQSGADVKAADNMGENALHRAASGGHLDLIKLLLERGLDVNGRDHQRQTPLYQAAQQGRTEAVKFLLSRQANPAFTDVFGETALVIAEKRKHEDVARLLRAAMGK